VNNIDTYIKNGCLTVTIQNSGKSIFKTKNLKLIMRIIFGYYSPHYRISYIYIYLTKKRHNIYSLWASLVISIYIYIYIHTYIQELKKRY